MRYRIPCWIFAIVMLLGSTACSFYVRTGSDSNAKTSSVSRAKKRTQKRAKKSTPRAKIKARTSVRVESGSSTAAKPEQKSEPGQKAESAAPAKPAAAPKAKAAGVGIAKVDRASQERQPPKMAKAAGVGIAKVDKADADKKPPKQAKAGGKGMGTQGKVEQTEKARAVVQLRPSVGKANALGRARDAKAAGMAKGRPGKADEDKVEISCELQDSRAPRGGQLVLKGRGFGSTPVVRIGPRVARIIRRAKREITVQVSSLSNGGKVTLRAGGKTIACGELTIIGKDN